MVKTSYSWNAVKTSLHRFAYSIVMQRSYGLLKFSHHFWRFGEIWVWMPRNRSQAASGCGLDTLRRLLGVSRCLGRFDHQQCSGSKEFWKLHHLDPDRELFVILCLCCNTCYYMLLILLLLLLMWLRDFTYDLLDVKMDVHLNESSGEGGS